MLSILLVPLFSSTFLYRRGGWTSFSHPKDSGVFLMTRLCSTIAWNGLIFHEWDGVSQSWRSQKIPFPFLESIVPLLAVKRSDEMGGRGIIEELPNT